MATRPRILFLDAYDSFSNNITALLATLLDADVFVLPIDAPLLHAPAAALCRELAHYTAVVCGPGPGSPLIPRDVGLQARMWDLDDANLVPVLGICLGFQSLLASCGGRVRRLRRGLHGMVRSMAHRGLASAEAEVTLEPDAETEAGGADVFSGVGDFRATLYHSLCVDVGQDDVAPTDWAASRWRAPPVCPDVVPLAWADELHGSGDGNGNGNGNGDGQDTEASAGPERILMAARHRTKPFWGLQYHAESVCTEEEGNRVVVNWFRETLRWNASRGRTVRMDSGGMCARNATLPSLLSGVRIEQPRPTENGVDPAKNSWESLGIGSHFHSASLLLPGKVQVPDIVEALESADGSEKIVLESSNAASANAKIDERCRYSIIALDVQDSLRVEYRSGSDTATVKLGEGVGLSRGFHCEVPLGAYGGIWGFLASFHQARRKSAAAHIDSPFLGGFMGYVTYEQGLHGIGIPLPNDRSHSRPDICLAWVTKSIVVDHSTGVLHVQHLRDSAADTWGKETASKLLSSWESLSHPNSLSPARKEANGVNNSIRPTKPRRFSRSIACVQTPGTIEYEEKVKTCQGFIAAGESYELCLTDQTRIFRPRSDPISTITTSTTGSTTGSMPRTRRRSSAGAPGSWSLFKTLRTRQPAPFASYVRLGGATLVSASPERFLCYDRDGLCSMRPMKGTVRKSAAVATLAQARALLRVPKEEAENLMIVDLVRHDLHGVCGPGRVTVPRLLHVEEYQSIFTMVTIVEGRLPGAVAAPEKPREREREVDGMSEEEEKTGSGRACYTGLDVLAASLPPGSMTGAPKKRSCQILRQIEQGQERSLYSGVVGYTCVSGAGDWSVTIRAMFRWDDEQGIVGSGSEPHEVWRIGAGGAVTILSTPEGEREEMFTKLAGPLGVFTDSA